jgi:hypothetical protein
MITNYLRILRKSYANFRGWSTTRKLLLFESDDWGSVRIKDKKSFDILQQKGIDLSVSRYTKFDKLEEAKDLEALFSVLTKFKDKNGNHPIFSPNYLVANPDFEKIKKDDFHEYHYINLRQSYDRYSGGNDKMFKFIEDGIANRIFVPQFHGREHLHPLRLLKCLSASKIERQTFDLECIPGLTFSKSYSEYIPYMSAFDYYNEDEKQYSHYAVEDGLNLFEKTFGFKSKTFIPSQSVMGDDLFSTLTKNGVQLSKAGARILPSMYYKNQKMAHDFWGFNEKYGIYFSRANCNFEPNKDSRDWVSSCLADIELAFKFNKPAVISTHRVNYIGSMNEANRTESLKLLEILIKRILHIFKDIEFVGSPMLIDIMKHANFKI